MSNRWWGPRSDFPWEEDALKHIRDQVPESPLYRAWQTFTFTAPSGHVREVDLLVAAPAGLFLVEIKSHPGRVTNQGSTWLFRDDRVRTIENPLHLTSLKAKELKSQLQWAAKELGLKVRIPFVQEAVFLSAPNLRCELDDVQRLMVFGRDGLEKQTGLPGIWTDLLGRSPRSDRHRVDPAFVKQLDKLRQKIGVQGPRKHRRVGPYELSARAFDAGPTWEDYLGENTAMPGDQPRRIRVYLSELRATREERESARRAARREYLALQGIAHEGIVQAEQFSDEHEAGPSIIFRHGKDWQRLDHFMAEHGDTVPVETRVEMVRQLAEAVDHAHRRHLYHRALAARSVYVELDGHYPRLRIGDWQVSARLQAGASGRTGAHSSTPTSLTTHVEGSAGAYLAPEFGNPEAESTQLDVFGLGSVSHLVLTGSPPAANRKGLAKRLGEAHALVPSAVSDDVSPAMDDLIRGATAVQPVDRFDAVGEFFDYLELVEEELTAPDTEVADLLDATRGTVVAGWRIERKLGKGSTAEALLVTKDGHEQVLKVALNDSGRERLFHEAAQLRGIHDSHIVRLIVDEPVEVGPRTALVLERAGERTLTEYLKREGRLTIDELEGLGDDLFEAVKYLDGEGIWHRDIKPANLAIRELPKKGRRLVLFDFSLAGAADRATEVGTPTYLDPFLGTDRRPAYDAAAERYAVAVTLHEMASAELPSWGDGVAEANLLPPDETLPQIAEDGFDPLLRDRLTAFFRTALHRDPEKRHESLKEMMRAWSDVFRDLDETPPATTSHTVNVRPTTADEARKVSAANVKVETPLVAAGLSARALSTALQQLDVSTVGELIKIPAIRIQRLRGVGLGVRNELVKRAREWRQQLSVGEQVGDVVKVERTTSTTDLRHLSLDEVADLLVPKGKETLETRVARLALALPGTDGSPAQVPAWAPHATIAKEAGISQPYVGTLLGKVRTRWTKSVRAMTTLRTTVLELLNQHGRVMETGQLAAALLAARGSEMDDPAVRLALAEACVRAAVETEEHLDNPRLAKRRSNGQVLLATVAEDDPTAPTEEELLDYAVALGKCADQIVDLPDAAPLPSPIAVRQTLITVVRPEGMPPLSDTDMVSLAAAASQNAAATARLELYPRDLDAKKALRLAQATGYLGAPGITPDKLRDRVLARFPKLTHLPEPGQLRRLLEQMGHKIDVVRDGGQTRYLLPGSTHAGSWSSNRTPSGVSVLSGSPRDDAWARLRATSERGGFLAVKVRLSEAVTLPDSLRGLPGVTPLNLTETFVTTLRQVVAERGKPRWPTVLAADTAEAPPSARTGFGRLLDEVWSRVDARVRSLDGTVLLHDATPLARYPGGVELLSRLSAAARRPDEAPYGLWLVCPMDDPRSPARLDATIVGALGENEQLAVPRGFASDNVRSAS